MTHHTHEIAPDPSDHTHDLRERVKPLAEVVDKLGFNHLTQTWLTHLQKEGHPLYLRLLPSIVAQHRDEYRASAPANQETLRLVGHYGHLVMFTRAMNETFQPIQRCFYVIGFTAAYNETPIELLTFGETPPDDADRFVDVISSGVSTGIADRYLGSQGYNHIIPGTAERMAQRRRAELLDLDNIPPVVTDSVHAEIAARLLGLYQTHTGADRRARLTRGHPTTYSRSFL